jgi:pentatricopeptide repeat protein
MLSRAARFLCLRRTSQHELVLTRLLSAGSRPSDEIKSPGSVRGRSLQRSESSSSCSNGANFTSPRHSTAKGDAIGMSQALTAHIGELGKQGRWRDVILALEAAENDGQQLFVNNFSAAINALIRSRQPERALQLLPLMRQRGIEPNVVTYNSLIDAYSKSEQWQKAIELLSEMRGQEIVPNEKSYTAAIDACSRSGQWQAAERLLHEMQQQGIKPNEKSYTAVIDAYSPAGLWQKAIALLHKMLQRNVMPNVQTYTSVIDACSSVG